MPQCSAQVPWKSVSRGEVFYMVVWLDSVAILYGWSCASPRDAVSKWKPQHVLGTRVIRARRAEMSSSEEESGEHAF